MEYIYKTQGTCSSQIIVDVEDKIIKKVTFIGGCNGNLKGISKLVEGKNVDEVIPLIEGIKCGFKQTSCPDQLSKALKEATK